nr:uncharacterized protein LOC113828975 [Penaeus vannamei]
MEVQLQCAFRKQHEVLCSGVCFVGRGRGPPRPSSAARLLAGVLRAALQRLPVLAAINTGFDCADLPYGYYADEANNCAIFHVCLPYIDHNVYISRHFSFMCAPGSIFDQERLVCDFPEMSLPCSEAANFRSSNAYFGREDVNFLEK